MKVYIHYREEKYVLICNRCHEDGFMLDKYIYEEDNTFNAKAKIFEENEYKKEKEIEMKSDSEVK